MARRRERKNGEEVSYWQSYSDMMAAVLLVFVLILSFTMFESKTEIEAEKAKLVEKEAQIEEQASEMKEQEEKLAQQEVEMAEQEKLMDEQQKQLDRIIGIRSDLVKALREEFDGSNLSVFVDEKTGAITFDSNVLFDVSKSEIKGTGLKFLDDFLPRYFSVMMDPDFQEYVAEIIIEGHTDTRSDYLYNLELSQQRALAVATYCLADNSKILSTNEIEELRNLVTANGRSFSDPIYNNDGTVNMDKSRRVEFKFRLKDEEMVQEMIDILNEQIN